MAENNSGITRCFAIYRYKALERSNKDTLIFICIILNMHNGDMFLFNALQM